MPRINYIGPLLTDLVPEQTCKVIASLYCSKQTCIGLL